MSRARPRARSPLRLDVRSLTGNGPAARRTGPNALVLLARGEPRIWYGGALAQESRGEVRGGAGKRPAPKAAFAPRHAEHFARRAA